MKKKVFNWSELHFFEVTSYKIHILETDQQNLFVKNHVKLEVPLRVLYCVVDTSNGLGRSLGDCIPTLPKGRKYQMVKTHSSKKIVKKIVKKFVKKIP